MRSDLYIRWSIYGQHLFCNYVRLDFTVFTLTRHMFQLPHVLTTVTIFGPSQLLSAV